MNPLGFPLLSVVVFTPLFGAAVALLLGKDHRVVRLWALTVALVDLALAGLLWALFDYGQAGMQFVDRLAWIEALGIGYSVGVDGISLWLLLLTSFVGVVAVGMAWHCPDRSCVSWLLVLETGVLGVFAAIDLVLFYIFWEAVLIPAYFLIGRGGERPARAAQRFFLYTMAGSALMLVAILALAILNYRASGVLTFDRLALSGLPLARSVQMWLFLAFALAFAVKAPLWPLHSWLPDAYVESPAPVTAMLAGVLSKMAVYGLIRLCLPLFPAAVEATRPWLWSLAVVGILYGSLMALVQRDLKRLVAYSSLAHLGLIVAGCLTANVQGVQGALLLSVSHGLTVTALFVFVDLLEARRGTRLVEEFGGLWKSVPLLGTLFLTVLLASLGLPGLSAFPGEFTLLVGLFQSSPAAAICAALGMVLGAWYLLNLFRTAFAGPLVHPENRALPDLRRREAAMVLPLVALIFVLGLLPNLILRPTDSAVDALLRQAEERRVVRMEGSRQQAASSR